MTPTTDTPKTSTHHPRSMSTNIPTPSRSFSSNSGTGIPAFRSLRSLLPFGPGKSSSSTPAKAAPSISFSSASSPTATASKTPNSNSKSLSKAAGHGYSLSVSQTQGNSSFGAGRSFTAFGTVRRSMTKERGKGEDGSRPSGSFLRPSTKVKPAEETFDDVIAIGPEASTSAIDVSADVTQESGSNTPLRRSVSYPRLDKDVIEQDSRDLSTIIEADTSGLSRYLPDLNTSQTSSPSRSPPSRNSPLTRTQSDSLLRPVSTFLASGSSSSRYSASTQPSPTDNELELSVSNVQGQVLDALLVRDYAAAREWLDSGDAVVVDDDEDLTQTQPLRKASPPPDSRVSLELGPLDPELTALLSPNRLSGSSSPKRQSLSSRRSSVQLSSRASSQRNSLPTPFSSGQGAENPPSSLPRLRSPVSIPSRSPLVLPSSSLPSPSPLASPPISASPPHSPFVPLPVSSSPRPSPLATTTIFPSRSSRQSSPERRLQHSYQPAPPSPLRGEGSGASGDLENQEPGLASAEGDEVKEAMKESTESQRIQRDYQARTKPSALLPRLITPSRQPSSPSSPTKDTDAMPEGYEARLPSRRTFTTPSPALQIPRSARSLSNRPSPASSVVGDGTVNASPATTSMIMDDTPSSRPRPSLDESRLEMMGSSRTSTGRRGLTHIQMKTRMRKRSMSVENGSPGLSIGSAANRGSPGEFGMLSVPGDDDTTLNGLRPSSSLSNRREGGSSGSQRTLDWMGPRAATRAFAAAGLLPLDRDRDREFEQDMDRERERERDRRLDLAGIRSVTPTLERTNSRAVTPNNFGGSTAQGLSRYGSQRGGTSEFRAQSRMAFSESAGPSIAGSRKGSGSYSAANSHNNTPSSYGNSSSYGSATTGTRYTRERGGSVSVSVAGSAVSPLMDSPTFSESMRGRGTPMSVSTAPTSILSGASERGRGFVGDRERDKERERLEAEMERMRDKHSLEMGALLSALSDSQRTTKVLREENTSLRDRLDSALEEVHMLRTQCEERKWEVEMLRGNNGHAGNESVFGGGSVADGRNSTPTRWRSLRGWGSEAGGRDVEGNASIGGRARGLGLGLPSVLQRHRERLEPGFSTAHQRRTYTPRSRAASASVSSPQTNNGQDDDLDFQTQRPFSRGVDHGQGSASDSGSGKVMPPPPPPSMKGKPQHRRRSSTTSSVFPNPPPGMAMLTLDPQSDDPDFAALASFSMTPSRPPSFASSNPRPIGSKNARAQSHHKRSQSSVGNVSPTTANFSMTGSPGSLNLRPEDELHLKDMDIMSLNLRIASGDESDGE
ncbi:hypothetical protein PLEOSDRAFT_1108071 [Pleurotus ostreatus PC15]|uniref:Uncharacterized protein n=1 Tax=Pleurotus ostreatus (strain PC15) TaxID=1137138 RepID=A0A067N6U4_PLEO1|nr:hypothetical protein PLEOSDRAFT_1108071 [Pleurotus ostreatus PC15]